MTLQERDAPSVYASVLLFQPRQGPQKGPDFQMGIVELPVSADARRLKVTVEPVRAEVEPGDPVQVRLRVTDAEGRPVQAELAVAVPDEGVLQVAGYKTPDPLKAIYRSEGLAVRTSASLLRLLEPLAEEELGIWADGSGADARPKRKQRVRKKFPPLAYWNPSIETDERGEAVVDFRAPDGLTSYRIMAVAADLEHRFGSGEARLTISKKLMVTPSLPRFVRPGDQMKLPVALVNRTAEPLQVTLRAKVRGARLQPARRTVQVPAQGRQVVEFDLDEVDRTAELLRFRFSAEAGALEDAVQLDIPVRLPALEETSIPLADWIEPNEAATARLAAPPPDLLKGTLVVQLDRTGLVKLSPGLRYLVKYPYGCLEQTLSRMLPLLAAKEMVDLVGTDALGGDTDKFLEIGIAKVQRHQRYDGRFRLWPDERANVYLDLSALAVWGLHRAKAAGFTVDEAVLSKGIEALRRWASEEAARQKDADSSYDEDRLAAAALAAFVLTEVGKPAPDLEAKLFERRKELNAEGLGWLWIASASHHDQAARTRVRELRTELLKHARGEGEGLVLRLGRASHYWGWGSDARATAIALLALVRTPGNDPMTQRLTTGLEALQQRPGFWGNTQANLWAITALTEQARRRTSRSSGTFDVEVTLGDRTERVRIEGKGVSRLEFPLPAGAATLTVRSPKPVFAQVSRLLRRDASGLPAARRGFTVRQRYLDPRSGQPVEKLRLGQLVRIVTEVVADNGKGRFVAAVAPLPAGLEPVDTSLATEQTAEEDRDRYSWDWDHRELRDDRVTAFQDDWGADKRSLGFLARATTVGRFLAPGAHAEAMYRPEVSGRTEARWVEVTP